MSVLCVSMKHWSSQFTLALLNYSIIKYLSASLRSYMIAITHKGLKQLSGTHLPVIKPQKHVIKLLDQLLCY